MMATKSGRRLQQAVIRLTDGHQFDGLRGHDHHVGQAESNPGHDPKRCAHCQDIARALEAAVATNPSELKRIVEEVFG